MMAVPSSAVTAVYVIGQIVMIAGKDILTRAHGALVFGRRVRILAANLAKEISIRAEVLDVGTGDRYAHDQSESPFMGATNSNPAFTG